MAKITPAVVLAATVLSVALPAASPAQATPLAAAANMRLASETVSPVTNVTWWGHRRFQHRSFFFHHRPFFFHRFHHRRFFFVHRFHRCRWC